MINNFLAFSFPAFHYRRISRFRNFFSLGELNNPLFFNKRLRNKLCSRDRSGCSRSSTNFSKLRMHVCHYPNVGEQTGGWLNSYYQKKLATSFLSATMTLLGAINRKAMNRTEPSLQNIKHRYICIIGTRISCGPHSYTFVNSSIHRLVEDTTSSRIKQHYETNRSQRTTTQPNTFTCETIRFLTDLKFL